MIYLKKHNCYIPLVIHYNNTLFKLFNLTLTEYNNQKIERLQLFTLNKFSLSRRPFLEINNKSNILNYLKDVLNEENYSKVESFFSE